MVENNEENRAKLAREVVDNMDLDSVLEAMQDHLENLYAADQDVFEDDWAQQFEESGE